MRGETCAPRAYPLGVIAVRDARMLSFRGSPMSDDERITVGARVRIRRSVVPGLSKQDEDGVVIRSDARGVLVRLDSGRTTLCEPGILQVIARLVRDDEG